MSIVHSVARSYKGADNVTDINYEAIEAILFSYKDIPLRVRSLELEIKRTEHTYETFRGRSNNEIMPGSRNNQTSNSVENALLNKEKTLERLNNEIKEQQFNKEMVEIALESLTDIEKKIIEDKYFNKLSYYRLGVRYYFSKEWAFYTCRKIIENKISKYINV